MAAIRAKYRAPRYLGSLTPERGPFVAARKHKSSVSPPNDALGRISLRRRDLRVATIYAYRWGANDRELRVADPYTKVREPHPARLKVPVRRSRVLTRPPVIFSGRLHADWERDDGRTSAVSGHRRGSCWPPWGLIDQCGAEQSTATQHSYSYAPQELARGPRMKLRGDLPLRARWIGGSTKIVFA